MSKHASLETICSDWEAGVEWQSKEKPRRGFQHFLVPAKCYPKYRYMYNEAKPLWKRYDELLKQIELKGHLLDLPYPEISVLYVYEKQSESLSVNDISPASYKDIKCTTMLFHRISEESKKTSFIVAPSSGFRELLKTTECIKGIAEIIILEIDGGKEQMSEGYITTTHERLASTIETCLVDKIKLSFQDALKVLQSIIQPHNLSPNKQIFYTRSSNTVDNDEVKKVTNAEKAGNVDQMSEALKNTERLDTPNRTCTGESRVYTPETNYSVLHASYSGLTEMGISRSATKSERKRTTFCPPYLPEDVYRKHHSLQEDAEQLYGSINAMLYRCGMPTDYRMTDFYKVLSKEDADRIFGIHGVIRIGYRFSSLNVYLDDSLDQNSRQMVEEDVTKLLRDLRILKYKIVYEQKQVTNFAEVGSRILIGGLNEASTKARIGGFAKLGQAKQLCILLSRHAICEDTEVKVEDPFNSETFVPFGKVLFPKGNTSEGCFLDISIAKVTNLLPNVKCQLRDEYGTLLPNILFSFDQADAHIFLHNLPVHISRASQSPGLGLISIPIYKIDELENTMIEIEDRDPEEGGEIQRFAMEGDSGSIVCANDISGSRVHAIGMLIGSTNDSQVKKTPTLKRKYVAFRLIDGLEQLKLEQDESDLALC